MTEYLSVCVRACVRACVCVCVWGGGGISTVWHCRRRSIPSGRPWPTCSPCARTHGRASASTFPPFRAALLLLGLLW